MSAERHPGFKEKEAAFLMSIGDRTIKLSELRSAGRQTLNEGDDVSKIGVRLYTRGAPGIT